MNYDNWISRDLAMERAGRVEEALDVYEDKVWYEVLRLVEEQYKKHRNQLYDQLINQVRAEDAAQNFLESIADE